MTTAVMGPDGRMYLHHIVPPEPVFVADQRRQSSAYDQPHTGPATLLARLDPVQPGGEALATVRLPHGGTVIVAAALLCPTVGLASRRILPAQRVRRAM